MQISYEQFDKSVLKKSKPKSARSISTPVDKIEDGYQRYAVEELGKNTKQYRVYWHCEGCRCDSMFFRS